MRDRRIKNDYASRSEIVADHPYYKLGMPLIVAGGMGLLVFLAQFAFDQMNSNIEKGLQQINLNVTSIAVNANNIAANNERITEVKNSHNSLWRALSDRSGL